MGDFFNSIKNLISFNEDYEDEADYYEDEIIEAEKNKPIAAQSVVNAKSKRGNVMSMQNPNILIKICIHEPIAFDEVQNVVDDLLQGKAIVLNMEQLDVKVQQRIVDFVNGAVYALAGKTQEVTNSIFILAPKNVEIDNLKNAFAQKGLTNF